MGCYVEAQATHPPGTALHLKLEAKGIRVESQAVVRVTYPYLGMGISFEDILEENKAGLRRLLAALSHRSVAIGPGGASPPPAGGPVEEIPAVSDGSGRDAGFDSISLGIDRRCNGMNSCGF